MSAFFQFVLQSHKAAHSTIKVGIIKVYKSKVHFNKSFSYDAPKLWNDLPLEIRTAPTLSCFKTQLKSYLFQKSFPP